MKGHSHHFVAEAESFLNTVAMVKVNIHIQHMFETIEELENGQHNVIAVAETGCL